MKSEIRQQAEERLTQIQAQLYGLGKQIEQLENEARTLAGFINLANQEAVELAYKEPAGTETVQ